MPDREITPSQKVSLEKAAAITKEQIAVAVDLLRVELNRNPNDEPAMFAAILQALATNQAAVTVAGKIK